MWYSNDTFHYMFKAEFVSLVSLKVPSGCGKGVYYIGLPVSDPGKSAWRRLFPWP